MSHKKIAFLFPGQGAQYVGMGKDFYENYSIAKETFQEGEEILQSSLLNTIFEGPIETLTETRNSQTGIYLTSMAILRVLQKQFPDITPEVCAGLSLGEYTAVTASGRLTFEQCLPVVAFRAEAMNRSCEQTKGTMAAIFGFSAQEVDEMVVSLHLPDQIWVANYNCPGQTVVSGTVSGVEAAMALAKERGARRVIPLKVHGAFHSGLMKQAEDELATKINPLVLSESSIGIVMNVVGDYVTDREAMKRYLIQQVTSPVRWDQGICAIKPNVDLCIEIGCGTTLSGMNRKMNVPTQSISKVEDLEKLAESME